MHQHNKNVTLHVHMTNNKTTLVSNKIMSILHHVPRKTYNSAFKEITKVGQNRNTIV